MSYDTVQLEMREQGVAVIILNRPEALNALTTKMAEEFMSAVGEARRQGARALVVTGAGRAFCAGGDLKEMQSVAEREGRIEAFFDEPLGLLNECVLLLQELPLPVIAAVNGVASGGGCNLALACDIVIAAERARFNQAFVKVGLSPDCGGTYILPRLVGLKRAAELMMTGDVIDARSAAEMGMINRVVADDELMHAALGLATRLAESATGSIAKTKRLLAESATNQLAAQLEAERQAQIESGQTKDYLEAVAAFIEKRPPRFAGG
ncbi:MAG TPA: enoyl-CoA hydratase-related protein [Pyrinomonadaceae bacterium]|nr:enoyl-CoA hydratase-related protein [Pyrinomonadaceae bacterium]